MAKSQPLEGRNQCFDTTQGMGNGRTQTSYMMYGI